MAMCGERAPRHPEVAALLRGPRRMHGNDVATRGPSPFEALASLGHLRVTEQGCRLVEGRKESSRWVRLFTCCVVRTARITSVMPPETTLPAGLQNIRRVAIRATHTRADRFNWCGLNTLTASLTPTQSSDRSKVGVVQRRKLSREVIGRLFNSLPNVVGQPQAPTLTRHPEVRAKRASKDDGPAVATSGPCILRGAPSGAHLRMTVQGLAEQEIEAHE